MAKILNIRLPLGGNVYSWSVLFEGDSICDMKKNETVSTTIIPTESVVKKIGWFCPYWRKRTGKKAV